MEVSGTNATRHPVNFVDPNQTGFNSLKTEDFLKLLLAQLENQDPTQPVSNEDLLNQVSMLSNLQSNLELSDSIETLASAQGLATAAAYIGKSVTATDVGNEHVTGIVDRAFVSEGKTYIGIGDQSIALDKLLSVEQPAPDATPAA